IWLRATSPICENLRNLWIARLFRGSSTDCADFRRFTLNCTRMRKSRPSLLPEPKKSRTADNVDNPGAPGLTFSLLIRADPGHPRFRCVWLPFVRGVVRTLAVIVRFQRAFE